jgi:glutaredoxin-related protein
MTVNTKIKQLVEQNEVLLFMKGSPKFPQCGFSSLACQILEATECSYQTVDVLQDPEVREGIKVYSGQQFLSYILRVNSLVERILCVKCMTQVS